MDSEGDVRIGSTDYHNTLTASFNLIYFPRFLLCWLFSPLLRDPVAALTIKKCASFISVCQMLILCRRSEGGSHQVLPACPQICHLLAIFHHSVHWSDIVGRRHALKGPASGSAIELTSTSSPISIYKICSYRQSNEALSACNQQILGSVDWWVRI